MAKLENNEKVLRKLDMITNGPDAEYALCDAITGNRVALRYPDDTPVFPSIKAEDGKHLLSIFGGHLFPDYYHTDDIMRVETYTDGVIGIVTKKGAVQLRMYVVNPVNLNEIQVLALLK